MQGMADSGRLAAHTSAYTVTVIPTLPVDVDAEELKEAVLHHLNNEDIQTTDTITTTNPRGVLCSFADACTAHRAKDILKYLSTDAQPDAFKINLHITHPSHQPSMNVTYLIPKKHQRAQAGMKPASAAAAAAAAAAEPAPPAPAEPAGSSQLARMGCPRHQASGPPSVNGSSSRHRYRETDPEPRRRADERGSGSGHSRHPTLHTPHVSRRELEDGLLALRPYASNCHLAAPRRRDAEQPQSGQNEMYIFQQRGDACGIKNVGNLHFPQLLCDSLGGARILRGVAALLHTAFYKPDSSRVAKRLKRCFENLIPTKLQRMLVADCQAYAGRRHADAGRRGIEEYLTHVVYRMVARRR